MKKFSALFPVFFFISSVISAKSLWTDGGSLYTVKVKQNDIIRIQFTEKTLMKYKTEQRRNNYESIKGKKGGGSFFSFFPDAEVGGNDTVRNQNDMSVNRENRFTVPAKVLSIEGNTAAISGVNTVAVNGEFLKVSITGEFDTRLMQPDNSLFSTDIYNLEFRVENTAPQNEAVFSDADLVYSTNYTEMLTNQVFDPTNQVTNTVITTNLSAVKIELKGLTDSKKREIVSKYMNFILNALFR